MEPDRINQVLHYLAGGDLRSDGLANEVVGLVLANAELLNDLVDGLANRDDVVRGRTADVLEKVSRDKPEYVQGLLPRLIRLAQHDPVPMVRWHAVMILTNLLALGQKTDRIVAALRQSLQDESAFVKSWAIAGLCIVGRKYPDQRPAIIEVLSALQRDASIAVRHRAAKAVRLLVDDQRPLPAGWLKSTRLKNV